MLCITFHTSLQSNVNYTCYKLFCCLFCALSPPFPRYPKAKEVTSSTPRPSSTVQPPPKGGEHPLHSRQLCWRSVRDKESPAWHVWVELILYTEPKDRVAPLQKPCLSP